MGETFDAFRYIGYMRSRLPWIAGVCGAAVALAVGISLALPREFTATARVVIEPPGSADLRSTMAVSPIYLESLKTYEQFAASDSLFAKAIEKWGLRAELGSRPVESLKRQILKVGIVRNTRILEISATLPDPRKAQALAQFLAESAVELSRATATESDRDAVRGLERQQRELEAQLQQKEAAWAKAAAAEPVEDLQAALESAAALREKVEEQALSAELEIADAGARAKEGPAEAARFQAEAANSQARLAQLRKQIEALGRRSAEQEKLLAQRMAHKDRIEAERKEAQAELTAMATRLREARGMEGLRGERLRIIDPGIVPERPSFPNLPLNAAAAMLLGLVLPVLYFTLQVSLREQRAAERVRFHSYAKTRDE